MLTVLIKMNVKVHTEVCWNNDYESRDVDLDAPNPLVA